VAWLGMSNMVLGLMLQPFNWLAPTLAPRLSMDVRAPDAPARVRHYLEAQLDPLLWLSLMAAAMAALVSLYTPVLRWIFGRVFQEAAHTIATTAFMAPAEVANMLIIQLVYAKSRESIALPAMVLKAAPFLLGLFAGLEVGWMLLVLNLGTWLMIGVQMWSVRECCRAAQVWRHGLVAVITLGMQLVSIQWPGPAMLLMLVGVLGISAVVMSPVAARLWRTRRSPVAGLRP